jgi:hypothetical protein
MRERRFQIVTPLPHRVQAEFIDSTAKRRVIVAGRRGGKTTGVSILAAEKAMEGRRVLEAAPTSDQTGAFWDAIKIYFDEPIRAGVVYKNETDRLMILPNGGRIRCKTAFDADTLRGDYADLLILDEYEMMKPDAWDKVGSPMLLDNDGDAVFIGTPMRRNHFFGAYNRAVADTTGRWAAWHFTSHDNPHLSKAALEEITADMTEEAYQQEILAVFLENEGAVFRNIAACMGAPATMPEAHQGHTIAAGVDWGKQQDFTAISIGCSTCRAEVARDRFNQIDWAFQYGRLTEILRRWNVSTCLVENNSIGDPGFEALQRAGLPVIAFSTTASTKPPLIENLALTLERAEWQFQPDPIWTGELEAYERKVSPVTGRSQYSAPDGMHDDTVIARALMVKASASMVYAIDNPFYD